MNFKKYDYFKIREPYYSGYRLLSTPDRYGNKPELFIATSNRSAGKSVFYDGYVIHKFIQAGEKFLFLYRNKYETSDCAGTVFSQVEKLFYPELHLSQDTGVKNVYDKLYLSEKGSDKKELCGFVTSLRASDAIKKYSSLLAEVSIVIFDEVFPEDDNYLPDEIQRLMSIHDSLARGGGKQSRYLPFVLIGNLINVFNPYYESLGIVDDLQITTNYMRGIGWVVEQGFNETSAKLHAESGFHQAFSGQAYTAAAQEKRYINTSYLFIDNSIVDSGLYLVSIRHKTKIYSVRWNERAGFYYCSNTPDPSFRILHAATETDVSDTAIYDPTSRYRKLLKDRYRQGVVRFKNMEVRNAILHFIIGK